MKNILLCNEIKMPVIGYGTFKSESNLTENAVAEAIKVGYKHIDAATIYGNEKEVGKGIKKGLKESGIKREELFVTGKLWNDVRGYDETIEAYEKTLEDLGLDYLDLYLIHWPVPHKYKENYKEKNAESWKAMEYLLEQNKVRAIGVSNFKIHHIKELMESAKHPIMVNQIQFHPNCTQDKLVQYCFDNDIAVEGYGSLGQGDVFKSEDLKKLANKYNTSVANLCIQFSIQKGVVPLVKSIKKERIKENLEINFIISHNDMKRMENVDNVRKLNSDSDNIDF